MHRSSVKFESRKSSSFTERELMHTEMRRLTGNLWHDKILPARREAALVYFNFASLNKE